MKDKTGPLVGWGAWPECLADGAASLGTESGAH